MSPVRNDLQRLLTAPILPNLLRLSAPHVLAIVMTVLVGIAETYCVGRLGTRHWPRWRWSFHLRCSRK